MATDSIVFQLEKVAKELPAYVNNWNVARNMVKKQGNVEMVGERDFRSPFILTKGGRKGKVDSNGGAWGRGTAQKGGVMVQTVVDLRCNFEMTQKAIDSTNTADKSRLNVFKQAVADAPEVFAVMLDEQFHSDGTAILGISISQSTVSSKTVYVMDTITSVNKLHVGDYVIPYNTGGTALNSGTAVLIEQINFETRSVYLSALIASAAGGDTLCLDGSTGSSPTSVQGINYFITDSTSGSTLGVSRATTWEIVSNSVDVTGVPTVMKGQQLLDKILTRRGGEFSEGMVWLMSPGQKSNLFSNVMNISRIDNFDGNLAKDLNTKAKVIKLPFCGVPGFVDPRENLDRMDLFIPSDWGRVQTKDVSQVEVGGQKVFILYDATTGSPSSNQWFAFYVSENYVCRNPGQSGYLKNLTAPSY